MLARWFCWIFGEVFGFGFFFFPSLGGRGTSRGGINGMDDDRLVGCVIEGREEGEVRYSGC